MTFATPVALVALVLIPALLVAYLVVQRRRVKYAMRFTNLPLLAGVVDRSPRWRRHVPPVLILLALAALIAAMARPQRAVAVPRKQGTVILTIDRSGSMLATDVSPTRMAAAKAAAASFIKGLPSGFKVGIVSFSDKADVNLPPTSDKQEALNALNSLQAENGTALGDAISRSVNVGLASMGSNVKVAPKGTPLVVVVLSDGASTTGDLQPMEAAQQAKTAKVPVYTVALGTQNGTITINGPMGDTRTDNVPPDPTTLRAVASATGGKFSEAADADTLKSIYGHIGKTVGTKLEKRELSTAFTGAGVVVLLLGSAHSLAWFNRLP
jgi:Ca-activated chloride channel family protein